MPGYLPPENINIPFTFTEQGYAPPNSTSLLFNFAERGSLGTLRAAVNVMTPYWYTTHTYTKSCPKYVVGYGSGGIQIIKGRCLYGGIRDLQGVIFGIRPEATSGSISAYLNPILNKGQSNLSTAIKLWFRENPRDLYGVIQGLQTINLSAKIDTHTPSNLGALAKVRARVNELFPAYIRGWQMSYLGMSLAGTHPPINLKAQMRVNQRTSASLLTYIHAWHTRYLTATLRSVLPFDFGATIFPIPPSDLSGYIKVRPQIELSAYTYGWGAKNLNAAIYQIWTESLSASIYSSLDTIRRLSARIKGYGSENKNLSGSIVTFHWELLAANIRATYLINMPAYLYPVVPVDLMSTVHVWHEKFLRGIITVQNYPWNLTAQINPRGIWNTLTANIFSAKGTEIYSNLTINIHPWETKLLSAYIIGSGAPILSAYLNPIGYAHDLHASIRPKMIRLTTVISIPTLLHSDLSAIINYPCFKTGYGNLLTSIYSKYKGDLYAYIRPIVYDYKQTFLSAKVGYTDSYLEVDKIRLSINISPSEFFTEDKYRIILNLLDAESLLTAYIRGTLRYNGISAYIVGERIPLYTFDIPIKNREIVIHKTYDGIFKTFEVVEMAFKSAVKDYFYSSAGEFAWKQNRFDKWVFDIKSMLPSDNSLHLARRLHKATTVYDLKKFNTVDEAIKFAIAYVTEYPQSTLGATIINRGTYNILSSVINPRYIRKSTIGLTSTINSVGSTIIINMLNTISKI